MKLRRIGARLLAACYRRVGRLKRPDIVFLGDSITEFWLEGDPRLFGLRARNRGRSGDTTAGMRARFATDVVAHRPRLVHLMGGTNDLWYGEPGPDATASIANVGAIVAAARAAGIVPIVALPPSIAPTAEHLFARPDLFGRLREGIRAACEAERVICVDYDEDLLDGTGVLRAAYTTDGVHLTPAGYRAMRTRARRAIVLAMG